MAFIFRQRRIVVGSQDNTDDVEENDISSQVLLQQNTTTTHDNEMVTMATNHMIAFILFMYGLYAICRFGFGWDAIRDPPPQTIYTVHIAGITDDDTSALRGS